jgi:predicted GIY-YIG superfamily endonuclease
MVKRRRRRRYRSNVKPKSTAFKLNKKCKNMCHGKLCPRDSIVYILTNTESNRTYVGYTNDSKNRIRKHNGKIKGGAKYTTNNCGTGEWIYHAHAVNLCKHRALSLEWYMHKRGSRGIKKRVKDLRDLANSFPESRVIIQ